VRTLKNVIAMKTSEMSRRTLIEETIFWFARQNPSTPNAITSCRFQNSMKRWECSSRTLIS
jgi:hypothetical protein